MSGEATVVLVPECWMCSCGKTNINAEIECVSCGKKYADRGSPDDHRTIFASGAARQSSVAGQKTRRCRYDLVSPIALRRLAETYAEGAEKYGEQNWRKGIPIPNLLNHALAHVNAYLSGDRSEDHLSHAIWNLATAAHFEEEPAS